MSVTDVLNPAPTDDYVAGSLRARAVGAVGWTALQRWSVRLSTFVSFLVLGRVLVPRDFGVVAVAAVFISVLTTLADAGFSTYLVQAPNLTERAKNTAFWIAVGSGTGLFLLSLAAAVPLADALGIREVRLVLPALASSLVLVGLSSVPASLLVRQLRFRALAVRQVTANLLSVVVALALAYAGAGVWALVGQMLCLRLATTAVLVLATDFRPRREFSRTDGRAILSYSLKAMGAQLLQQGRDQGEALLLAAIAGPVALGLWTVANRLVLVVGDLLGSVIGSVSAPMFARVQADQARLTRALSATAGLGMLLLAPALGLLAMTSPQLIPQVFGGQWRGAAAVAGILAVRGVLLAGSALDRSVLLNTGRAGGELALAASLTTAHLILVAALATQSLTVLALALLAEALLVAPVRPFLIHRWLQVPYRAYSGAARVLLATVLAGLISYVPLWALSLEGVDVYPIVLLTGGLAYPLLVAALARPVLREAKETARLAQHQRSASNLSTTRRDAAPSSQGQ